MNEELTRRLFLLGGGGALAVALFDQEEAQASPAFPNAVAQELQGLPTSNSVMANAPIGTNIGSLIEVPKEMRMPNYAGGSCVHASTETALNYFGMPEFAKWWRQNYSGGEGDERLIRRMEAAGLRYAYTNKGDENFLHWCDRTRRVAVIFYKPSHSINFVGEDQQYVYLLDNNDTSRPERTGWEKVERDTFYKRWHGYGGFAATFVYDPPPSFMA